MAFRAFKEHRMFCPACGFEYTQKTNYCKRCGEILSNAVQTIEVKTPRFGLIFGSIAAFCVFGLFILLVFYNELVSRGLRGEELLVPFLMGVTLLGAIAGLMIWQLSRLITAYHTTNLPHTHQRSVINEAQTPRLAKRADHPSEVVERPSVTEETTRQIADGSRESK
jgi:hypothetical protein